VWLHPTLNTVASASSHVFQSDVLGLTEQYCVDASQFALERAMVFVVAGAQAFA